MSPRHIAEEISNLDGFYLGAVLPRRVFVLHDDDLVVSARYFAVDVQLKLREEALLHEAQIRLVGLPLRVRLYLLLLVEQVHHRIHHHRHLHPQHIRVNPWLAFVLDGRTLVHGRKVVVTEVVSLQNWLISLVQHGQIGDQMLAEVVLLG